MSRAPDALMIVAHPDDDAVFGGVLQRCLGGLRWGVVCVTCRDSDARGHELIAWQRRMGTAREDIRFLGFPDDSRDESTGRASFAADEIGAALLGLGLEAPLIVTHNPFGEYGHPHHVAVHEAVAGAFERRRQLWFGVGMPRIDLRLRVEDFCEEVVAHFPSQAAVIRRLHRETGACRIGKYCSGALPGAGEPARRPGGRLRGKLLRAREVLLDTLMQF